MFFYTQYGGHRAHGWHGSAGGEKETEGRAGKKAGEPARTREAKLGCVFTQSKWDAEGYPIRDPDSTTFTGAIETSTLETAVQVARVRSVLDRFRTGQSQFLKRSGQA